ncbi:efflux pump antibiotic resistance protein [Penicillium concentricum]|uniref:Efflux pump antibiotic resistance protein n=1 Tax=Penicillium concentricum TaxID=293559 RepID=A0A9W9V9S7_9EURO|nr:efflux pump antibiotic resistance protein [Penicillium concentricum]KAJ5374198.1 efflux pump antibiotic resistance protein [Penicillium concentricum]
MTDVEASVEESTINDAAAAPQDVENESGGSVAPKGEPPSPRHIHGLKWFIAVCAILSSTFLFSLDNTVVADVQPNIVNDFGSAEKLPWVGAAFGLGATSILPWGKAYGVFNIKWLYVGTVIIFEIGSAICGAANNMTALILGRVIAGVGGSGMYSGCLTYLAITTTPNEQPVLMSLVGMVWAVGTVLGPVVGGAFADSSATWRWAFYINLVIGAIFAPAYLFLLPDIDMQRNTPLAQKLKQVDWLGLFFFYAGMVCLIVAINFGGSVYSWSSGAEIAFWVVGGISWIIFGLTQHFTPFIQKAHRLYPTQLMRRPLLLNLQFQLFLSSGVLLGAAYYIPLYFQFAQGDSALQAAVRLLPYIMMVAAFALINGALMTKLGYYMPWYTFGGALILIGSALMYTVDISTKIGNVYGYTVLMGIGVGSYVHACYPVAQNLVGPTEIPDVISFMSVAQSTGITVFLAVMGTVYNNGAILKVQAVLPDATKAGVLEALTGTTSVIFDSLDEAVRSDVIGAIIEAMKPVWLILVVAGALSFVLSFFLGRDRLFGKR